jgi:hypothetical protein
LLRGAHVLDQAETVGPLRALVFDNIHALFNKMQPKSAWLYFFKFPHAQLRALDGRSSIAEFDLKPFGRFIIGLPVDRAEEHFNRPVGAAIVGMPDNIRQRFVDSTRDRAAIRRGESEGFRQTLHGAAYRTQQTGIAIHLQPKQQAAARVAVALPAFASPHWMEYFHPKLNLANGFALSPERTSFTH